VAPRKDFTQIAHDVFRKSVGEKDPAPAKAAPKKTPAQQQGAEGGKKRAGNLTPEQRKEIARKAAEARWAKKKIA
jgi:hypothetical protein